MNAYFVAATSSLQAVRSDQNIANRTALQLGQAVDLPYFTAFEAHFLSLPELYDLIDQQIQATCEKAGWAISELAQIPIFFGSTGYVIADCEARLAANQPLPEEYSIAVIGNFLRERYQTEVYSFATSCTSSAQGIHYAAKMVQSGACRKALVIGFEAFNRLTFEHFHSMHLLANEMPYLPMIEPKGIVLGEGLACVALANEPHADFYAEIVGAASLTDNQNLTNTSEPLLHQLIGEILRNAKLSAADIHAVKPHAVGGNSDVMEAEILCEMLPDSRWVLPKTVMGHTLGAAGAMETAFLLDGLQQRRLPDWQHFAQNRPLAQSQDLQNGYYLSYFLGFGGSNVGWIMKWGR